MRKYEFTNFVAHNKTFILEKVDFRTIINKNHANVLNLQPIVF